MSRISGDHCMLSVPTVIAEEDYNLQTIPPASSFVVPFRYHGEEV